jgi:hypothetical protein
MIYSNRTILSEKPDDIVKNISVVAQHAAQLHSADILNVAGGFSDRLGPKKFIYKTEIAIN